jgi:hypothetical protein
MELRNLSNKDLFERWRQVLLLKYRTDRPRKEAIRFASLFQKFLGDYPPSADLAKQFLSQYLDRKQNTRAGYYAQLAMFMSWYSDPIDDSSVGPEERMPELVEARDLDKIEEAIRNHQTHKELIQRDILLVRTLRQHAAGTLCVWPQRCLGQRLGEHLGAQGWGSPRSR